MKLQNVIDVIEEICPNELAEPWDNCGIQLRCENQEIDKILVTLEITEEVIKEAIDEDVDFIVTHHPLIFNSLTSVDNNNIIGKYILQLSEADISVYSCHTSFDVLDGGNNDYFGALMELTDITNFTVEERFCRKGHTPFEVTFAEFVHKVADVIEIEEKHFKEVGEPTKIIDTIGWCTGSGSEFIKSAVMEKCDLFVTGDVKYHDAQYAKENHLCVLDVGHYGSEKIFTENMADFLRNELNIEILESKVDINPFL